MDIAGDFGATGATVGGAGLGSKAAGRSAFPGASHAVEGAGPAGNAARAGAVAGGRLWEGRLREGLEGSVESGLAHSSEACEVSEAKDMVDLQGPEI